MLENILLSAICGVCFGTTFFILTKMVGEAVLQRKISGKIVAPSKKDAPPAKGRVVVNSAKKQWAKEHDVINPGG